MLATSEAAAERAAPRENHLALRDRLIAAVTEARLEREPYCHIYMEGMFPPATYAELLRKLPPKELYEPLNLRKWVRADGTSTRDECHLTADTMAKMPKPLAEFWAPVVRAMTDPALRKAVFTKLAPDLAERFEIPAERVPDMECEYEVRLVRDTEDYRIKPHPDGLNKIVTMQFYLPEDESMLDLGTSIFRRHRKLIGSSFEEVKRFPFKPNSAYAFAVSDGPDRKSWHGRETLSGFTGVRNTLMLLFQRTSPHTYHAV
jgi:hypothetical protein